MHSFCCNDTLCRANCPLVNYTRRYTYTRVYVYAVTAHLLDICDTPPTHTHPPHTPWNAYTHNNRHKPTHINIYCSNFCTAVFCWTQRLLVLPLGEKFVCAQNYRQIWVNISKLKIHGVVGGKSQTLIVIYVSKNMIGWYWPRNRPTTNRKKRTRTESQWIS